MELILSGSRLIEHLVAAPGLVVLLLALLAEHVADVVAVALLKLVHVHLLRELLLPESVSLVHGQAETLDEETQLQAAIVLQVVFVSQGREQGLHAGWEGLARVEVQVGEVDLVLIRGSLCLIEVEVNGTVVRQTDQHRIQTLILHELGEILESFVELLGDMGSEMSHGNLLQFDYRYISYPLV